MDPAVPPSMDSPEPIAAYTQLAVRSGLIEEGEYLPPGLLTYALDIVEMCATLAESLGEGQSARQLAATLRETLGGG